jgi:Fe-S-cluster containining protein
MAMLQAASSSEKRRLHMTEATTCSPGCHACCHRMMEVTVAEATVMVTYLRASGGWKRVREAASGLAGRARECSADSWFKMKTRCPVLTDDGMCGAHEVRPPACSVHFVTSDPAACDPWSSETDFRPVDMSSVYLEAQARIGESIPPGGIMSVVLPLPLALLLADRVAVRTDLTFEQAMEMMARET